MPKNLSGRDYKGYAGTTAPTNAFDKDDANYTAVGKITATNLDRVRATIDVSSKDDGDDTAVIGGRRSGTVSFTCRFDHTEDAGQAILVDAYNSESGTVYLCVSTGTTGDVAFSMSGVVTQASITIDDEGASQIQFSIALNGNITETTLT